MSHEITEFDRQEGIEQAWHGLTHVKPVIALRDCWLALWDIVKAPLFTTGKDGKPVSTEYCQLVASDNPAIHIGGPVSKETFAPISNAKFLAIIGEALAMIPGAIVASVGSVCGRARVFVSVKLPQHAEAFNAAGREFKPYLNFLNSHDQSAPFIAVVSFVCTVCNNTFRMNLALVEKDLSGINAAKKRSELRIKLKHTKHVADRLENVPEVIDGFLGATAIFKAGMEYLGKTVINRADVIPLFMGFLNPEIGAGLASMLVNGDKLEEAQIEALQVSTRRKNQVERLAELHVAGKGNNGATLADAFSAVTDFYSHESSGGEDNAAKQFVSSEFGAGQEMKEKAFAAFQNPEQVTKLIAIGKGLVAVQKAKE
jgi:hypothetical protein